MITDSPLTNEMIADTAYSQLILRIGDVLEIMIYDPNEDNSLIYKKAVFSDEAGRIRSIESAVYDNPALLRDYHKVTIIVETSAFVIVPAAVAGTSTRRALLQAAHPELGAFEMIEDPIGGLDAVILTAIPAVEARFLRRTFCNAPIMSHLVRQITYYRSHLLRGNTAKAFVNLREDSLDIVIMSHDSLFLTNRFVYRDPKDAVYYLLAATRGSKSCSVSEILLTGSKKRRDEVMPHLRRFCPYVMPMIFPSAMYRAGSLAMSMPFDMVILPITE